ncbi:MAG: A/G-specific adenine glycosylase [Crocinitomicaceae bacterium]|nr:A/G-specific adenine glycosylase [Crocinitomicaceae bacterium]
MHYNDYYKDVRQGLKQWYSKHARDLPWRVNTNSYGTWLSEIILQQTRMEVGVKKWFHIIASFPTVKHLADASEDQILKAWEGLGYYRRARFLHKAAKIINTNGEFPKSYIEWLKLPGVGSYTAAAISSISFNEAVAAVDGNVTRVISRLVGLKDPVNNSKGSKKINNIAKLLLDIENPGNHNQAMMELGALVCNPIKPKCHACPISKQCISSNNTELLNKIPLKVKTKKIQDVDLMWHLVRYKKFIVTIQFPSDGIWGNLWGFPNNKPSKDYFLKRRPLKPVVHLLTHKKIHANFFMWEAINKQALNDYAASINGKVIPVYDLKQLAMPRLITKHILPIISTL